MLKREEVLTKVAQEILGFLGSEQEISCSSTELVKKLDDLTDSLRMEERLLLGNITEDELICKVSEFPTPLLETLKRTSPASLDFSDMRALVAFANECAEYLHTCYKPTP